MGSNKEITEINKNTDGNSLKSLKTNEVISQKESGPIDEVRAFTTKSMIIKSASDQITLKMKQREDKEADLLFAESDLNLTKGVKNHNSQSYNLTYI